MGNKGRTYELDMVRDVNEATTDEVFCATLDYSGVASDSDADLVLAWANELNQPRMALVELKKRSGESGKRFPTHPLAGSTPDQNGLTELRRLNDSGPPWADRWFALKPDHRELGVFDANWLLDHVTGGEEGQDPIPSDEGAVEAFQPRETRGANVSMRKPTLDEWKSSTAGEDDAQKLLRVIGVPDEYIEQDNGC